MFQWFNEKMIQYLLPMLDLRRIRKHCPTLLASSQHFVGVEGHDDLFDAHLDVLAPELDFVQQVTALLTEPGRAIEFALSAWSLDHQANTPWRASGGVRDV